MGKWSQKRRHGGGGGHSGSLYPPILERDWDAFDGIPGGDAQIQVTRPGGPPLPIGADTLGVRMREVGSLGAWLEDAGDSAASFFVDAPGAGLALDVQAAWFLNGDRRSNWSAGVAHVTAGG